MNYTSLRTEHTTRTDKLNKLDAFLHTHYIDGKRAQLNDLARKLRLSGSGAVNLIEQWIGLRRITAGNNSVFKLGVFYTDLHARPVWFGDLSLNNTEKMAINSCSRGMDLPTLDHVAVLSGLVEAMPDGWDKVIAEATECQNIITSALVDNGFIPDGTALFTPPTRATLVRPRTLCGSQRRIDVFRDVTASTNWGYLTFAQLDKLLVEPIEAEDVVILRNKFNPGDNKDDWRAATVRIHQLIDDVTERGMLLARITNQHQRGSDSFAAETAASTLTPVLNFTNKNELGIVIKVQLDVFAGVGRFIVNK